MTRRATHLLSAVLLALLPAAAAVAGEPADEETKQDIEREVRRHRVVVHPGEEPEVLFWKEGGGPHPGFGMLMGRGFLGVQTTELTPDLRRHFGVPEDAGVLVGHIEPASPAEKCGLKVGDILTQADGEEVESTWDLGRAVRKKKEGETVTLEVWRDGKVQSLTATIAERERPAINMRGLRCKPGEDCELEMMTDPMLLAPAMERLGRVLGDKEMQDRILKFRDRNHELEKRLQELEKRLQELERQLAKGSAGQR